ncbi:hypothetical protein CB1_001862007 [Camelus ferus]|nr:hypothetical protein CB1_001862007 [Camelus ferus]
MGPEMALCLQAKCNCILFLLPGEDLVTMVEQLARFLGVSCDKAQLESLSEHCHQLVDQCCNAEALPVGRVFHCPAPPFSRALCFVKGKKQGGLQLLTSWDRPCAPFLALMLCFSGHIFPSTHCFLLSPRRAFPPKQLQFSHRVWSQPYPHSIISHSSRQNEHFQTQKTVIKGSEQQILLGTRAAATLTETRFHDARCPNPGQVPAAPTPDRCPLPQPRTGARCPNPGQVPAAPTPDRCPLPQPRTGARCPNPGQVPAAPTPDRCPLPQPRTGARCPNPGQVPAAPTPDRCPLPQPRTGARCPNPGQVPAAPTPDRCPLPQPRTGARCPNPGQVPAAPTPDRCPLPQPRTGARCPNPGQVPAAPTPDRCPLPQPRTGARCPNQCRRRSGNSVLAAPSGLGLCGRGPWGPRARMSPHEAED